MSGLYRSGHRTGGYKPAFHSDIPIFVRQPKLNEGASEVTDADKQKEPTETNHQAETAS